MNEVKKRTIAILGSTGSIGTQTLQVVEEHPDKFEVYAITANTRVDELIEQARKFLPEAVVIADESKYPKLKEALADLPIKVYGGYESICQIVESKPIDIVVTAMVGFSGLRPTINAIKAGKAIALANKETMVVAGELINELAMKYQTPILPVDSEHSAIFQCLAGEMHNKVEKLIARIHEGLNVALVSDAGTPAVADPGFLPLRAALESGLEPVVIPGVSAVTFSVTASGLPVDRFAFWNFVPVKSGRKRKFFEEIAECGYTVFCFESPYRIENTLKLIAEVMPEAKVAIIREATKVHEEVIRGSAAEVAALKNRWRGEFVIGICNKMKNRPAEEDGSEN